MTPSGDVSAHRGTFLRVSPPAWECYCARGDFLGANSCPNHLGTHFENVSAFLSYPAPGYPGRDPPLESYLSQRRLWGGRGTSRVRLPCPGAITMALKPHFPSLYHYSPVIRGLRPSHGVNLSMVFPTHRCQGVALWSPCFCVIPPWRHPARRRLILATLPLGDPCAWRHPTWATPYVDFDLDFVNARVRDGTK